MGGDGRRGVTGLVGGGEGGGGREEGGGGRGGGGGSAVVGRERVVRGGECKVEKYS